MITKKKYIFIKCLIHKVGWVVTNALILSFAKLNTLRKYITVIAIAFGQRLTIFYLINNSLSSRFYFQKLCWFINIKFESIL